mgnify:CR=1 FL=1
MCAVTLCRLGEREAGLAVTERALIVGPEDAGVKYIVACLYAIDGRGENAPEAAERAIFRPLEKNPAARYATVDDCLADSSFARITP